MKISEIIESIEKYAPKELAEEWDNVGLIRGNAKTQTPAVVLCLDITEEVYDICLSSGAKLCVSHHPFIFNAVKRLDHEDPRDLLFEKFIKSDIAIYAAHTNLDACPGGVSDSLLRTIGFEPGSDISGNLPIYGRTCCAGDITLFELYSRISSKLGTNAVFVNFDTDRKADSIFASGGAFDSEWVRAVADSGVDTVITGEMKHSDMVDFRRHGIAVLAAGHDASERTVLPFLAEYLKNEMDIEIVVCEGLDYNRVVF